MADEFAILEGTVPSSTGTQSITSGSITSCTAALLVWSGNYLQEDADATYGWAMYRPDDGANDDSFYQTGWFADARTTTTQARCSGANSPSGAAGVFIIGSGSTIALASVAFVATGIELTWSSVAGVTGGAGYKFWVLLFGGTSNVRLGTGDATGIGFAPDLILSGTHAAGLNTSQQLNWRQAIGAAANGASVTQGCFAWTWNNNADPVVCRNYASTAAFAAEISTTGTVTTGSVASISASGFSVSGGVANEYLAIKFTDDRGAEVGTSLFSGSGVQNVGSLSIAPKLVIGIVSGSDALDTQANDAGGETVGLFVSDGTTTKCVSFATKQGQTVDGTTPSVGWNRFSDGEVNLIGNDGTTAFRATSVTMRSGGISWDVQTAMSGAIVLIAIGQSDLTATSDDAERVSDGSILNLISYLVLGDTLALSDGLGGLELADGLTALQDTGSVFQGGAHKGTVLQGGAVAGVVEG